MAVSDLSAAKRWLWQHGRAHEWVDRHHADLPPCAYLVCDIFWITPEQLVAQMRRDWKWTESLYRPARRAAYRRGYR